ncbi:MAG: AAA family ATPase [Treponema sp.]|jgi:shikimate dehydrogenase|nr:AAA family ATPase [Treponema sp.]
MIQQCGLLGEKLSHSFSPQIHAELSGYEYRLFEKKPEELEDFLRHGDFNGLNVTIPYKKAVIPFCANLSETARLTGSVNTIIRHPDGSLYGYNTDFFGFGYLLEKAGVHPGQGKILVLGSGGSSMTVQAVLRDRGAKEIIVVSRTGADNYENLEKHCDAKGLINTTPVGMYPNNGVSPITDLGIFSGCKGVVDLIYNPGRTELMALAEESGIPAFNGLTMLAAQAKKSAELFTNTDIPNEEIERITAKIAGLSQNIVLIGMPGCGKTSTGTILAKKLKREFVDTDASIEKKAGKSIPRIFAEDGEDAFRSLECYALQTVCKESGLVIATGGGVVTRPENRRVIRQNSVVIFLDRDISQLPTAGRPLSRRDGIESLAATRLPLYRQWSDHIVKVHGIKETAADIIKIIIPGAAHKHHSSSNIL